MTTPYKPPKTSLTAYQLEVLGLICVGNPVGAGNPFDPLDMDQLLVRVGRSPTKAAMQFTIRALINNGMMEKGSEKRRGRIRVTYLATVLGSAVGSPPKTNLSLVEPEPGSLEADFESV